MKSEYLENLRWMKLKILLSHAYSNCPFYYEKYKNAGVHPEEIRSISDFQYIPVLTKSEIVDNLDKMLACGADSGLLEEVYTSGTTGVPLKVYRDRRKMNLMNALYLRTIRRWGCDIGSKTVWIWGLPKDVEKLYDYRYQSKLRRFLKNEAWFNAFDVTRDNMLGFSRFLNVFKPELVISHVSILSEFADFFAENEMSTNAPKAIWLTAEPSTSSQRRHIESVFRGKTFDQYGSSEIPHIAAECSERVGLHVHVDSRFVEILDTDDSPLSAGRLGNVVVTDLENMVVPMIRYKNGDLSSMQPGACTCGSAFPLMDNIAGRILDMVKLKDGRKIYGHIFASVLFKYVKHISQFQIHQTAFDKITIRIVPKKTDDLKRLKSEIASELRQYTGDLVSYFFEIVGHIRREQSGKLRYVKSDL